jgi:hypothetical protein
MPFRVAVQPADCACSQHGEELNTVKDTPGSAATVRSLLTRAQQGCHFPARQCMPSHRPQTLCHCTCCTSPSRQQPHLVAPACRPHPSCPRQPQRRRQSWAYQCSRSKAALHQLTSSPPQRTVMIAAMVSNGSSSRHVAAGIYFLQTSTTYSLSDILAQFTCLVRAHVHARRSSTHEMHKYMPTRRAGQAQADVYGRVCRTAMLQSCAAQLQLSKHAP